MTAINALRKEVERSATELIVEDICHTFEWHFWEHRSRRPVILPRDRNELGKILETMELAKKKHLSRGTFDFVYELTPKAEELYHKLIGEGYCTSDPINDLDWG